MLITKDGATCTINKKHMALHETVLPLLPEALQCINTEGRHEIKVEVMFDRDVGVTDCVETADGDEIVMAQRQGRTTITRFVKNRERPATQHVSMILKRTGDKQYRVITAWIGRTAEREPTDPNIASEAERRRCVEFWAKHALVWGSQPVTRIVG